jgi:hypothetical protein
MAQPVDIRDASGDECDGNGEQRTGQTSLCDAIGDVDW